VLDHLIAGGTVVDGTGDASFAGDVGVRDGRVVAIGPRGSIDEPAARTFDADGLVVSPGFVDPHTHYDGQLFWDSSASPSNVHGVTSVFNGNCGFTLAPLRKGDADYISRMMVRVEGMPLVALQTGVPWTWETFGDYLGALEGNLAVNAGFLVGHCALRRYVMGEDAIGGQPTAAQMDEMLRVLHESLDAGGLGFSTTQSASHADGDGNPVASRHAGRDELLALCGAVAKHEGTTLEGIVQGCLDMFNDDEIELLSDMSVAARRPLNWNVLTVDASVPERVPRQLSASDRAREKGGRLVALTMPVLVPMNMSLLTYCALHLLPGWSEILSLPVPERIAKLRDPAVRAEMLEKATGPNAGVARRLADFSRYVIGDTFSAENEGLKGRVVGEIAAERGQEPFEALVEIAAHDDLRTVLWPMPSDNNPESWELRRKVWEDPRAMLGGSDAGAHLDRMCGAPYTSRFIGDMIRGRQLGPLARAVQMITDAPAQLFGLRGRGRLAEGACADIVVFDPETIDSEQATLVADLPGGSARLTAGSKGVVRVLVNGVETVVDCQPTGATPGTVLRSGRDTRTVMP
jgi:N-acyl-D-aspartate/D-glutamate deacylase